MSHLRQMKTSWLSTVILQRDVVRLILTIGTTPQVRHVGRSV
jgi:hypothetical protein